MDMLTFKSGRSFIFLGFFSGGPLSFSFSWFRFNRRNCSWILRRSFRISSRCCSSNRANFRLGKKTKPKTNHKFFTWGDDLPGTLLPGQSLHKIHYTIQMDISLSSQLQWITFLHTANGMKLSTCKDEKKKKRKNSYRSYMNSSSLVVRIRQYASITAGFRTVSHLTYSFPSSSLNVR